MIWMTWQQHRFQLLIGSVLLVLLTVFLLLTGLTIASYYQDHVVSCVAVPTCTVYLFNRFQDVVGKWIDDVVDWSSLCWSGAICHV